MYSYRVAKRIAASDQFDLDLNRDLFVIYARRTTESSALMAIQTHSGAGARYFPGVEVNPATDMTGTVRIINCRVSVASIDLPAFWAEMSPMLWLLREARLGFFHRKSLSTKRVGCGIEIGFWLIY